MLKAIKYIYLANIYKKSKKNLFLIVLYLVFLVISSLMLNDIIAVNSGFNAYFFITIKWIVVLLMLLLIFLSFTKVINVVSNPLSSMPKDIDKKKDTVLSKAKLRTKSDQIIEKYMETK